jgi:hypothetical protein
MRFHLGQKVLITGTVIEKHRGRKGTIVSIQPNMYTEPGITSADKYIVRFEEGDDAQFFEIQLVAVEKRRKGA